MIDTLELFGLSLCGMAIHFMLDLIAQISNGKLQKMRVNVLILSCACSVLICFVLCYTRSSFTEIFPITKIGAVILGTAAQSIFKKIMLAKGVE